MKKITTPEQERANTIKEAVEKNFDASADEYDAFDSEHGYFENLARELALFAGIEEGMRVLDIGCGTGISSLVLGEKVGPSGIVIGIDLSQDMIDRANVERKRRKAFNIQYVKCDAERASTTMDLVFDAAVLNASIFLIPMTERVLMSASDCLRPEGRVAFNFLRYDFRENGKYYEMLDEACRPSLSPPLWDQDDIKKIINRVGLMKVKNDVRRSELSLGVVKDFYMVPAMSASLFPKLPYPERKKKVDSIFSDLSSRGVEFIEQEWERYYLLKPEGRRY